MKKKILMFITISLVVGIGVFTNGIENNVPIGTIKISNKVNGKYLAVKELTLWEQASRKYKYLVGAQGDKLIGDKAGYIIPVQNNLKSFCWLPIPQRNETIAFQYVCAGKYHNHYLDIQDNVTSDRYLSLMVRKELTSGSIWNINSKEDGTFTYNSSRNRFKGYYIAVKTDGLAKVYFGDIGPNARWHQSIHQIVK